MSFLPIPTGGRFQRAVLLAAVLAMLLGLAVRSESRHVGDSGEYVVMSLNLARLSRPSLTADDLERARHVLPAGAGTLLTRASLRAPDGRQDMPHFWFYSLLAAPFVRIALLMGADPLLGFTVLNILLLMGTAMLLSTRMSAASTVLVVVSPIVWWIDKAHTEVFTFALIAAALALLRSAPWWSIVAFGAAATQNPPMAGAMVMTIVFAGWREGWRTPRVWLAAAAGTLLAALHPLYYYARLGRWSGLAEAVDRHVPTLREVITPAFDPNLGIFVAAPFLLAAILIAAAIAARRNRWRRIDAAAVIVAAIVALFLISFTQTTNVNSGGTPGPSRYGVWLIACAVPLLASAHSGARWLRALAVASVLWSVWTCAPSVPEQYLRPSTVAAFVWQRWPGLDSPLAEVFAEREAGHEPARPPVATPGCEKVLLLGDGADVAWPGRCTPMPPPDACRQAGALCFANMSAGTYRFATASATPGWRAATARPAFQRYDPAEQLLVVTDATGGRTLAALFLNEGWSYAERLSEPAPGDVYGQWRWIETRAVLGINTRESATARVRFTARAFEQARRLRVSINGREIVTWLVSPENGTYVTPEFNLSGGTVLMAFESLDGSTAPGTEDTRRLSVQVFEIDLIVTR